MRGTNSQQNAIFSYISAQQRAPKEHPLRATRAMSDAALGSFWRFSAIYREIPPPCGDCSTRESTDCA